MRYGERTGGTRCVPPVLCEEIHICNKSEKTRPLHRIDRAVGAYGSMEQAIEQAVHMKKTFRPNPERQAYYARKYERFKKLYDLMHLF